MKIVLNLDDPETTEAQLRELAEKLRNFPQAVAEESAQNIHYYTEKGSVSARVEPIADGNRIVAENDQIAFMEFGAGFPAQNITIEGFTTYPGAWSEDHAQTFQRFKGDPDNYMFNRDPQMAMQNEAHRLIKDTERKAQEYFGN